jgi:glycosyltransferase involved in cell wall biosynthesis
LRILHVVTGLNTGGAESLLCGLIERLAALGVEQKVVSLLSEGPLSSRLRASGIACIHLGLRRGGPDFSGLKALRDEIIGYRPAAVHAWMYHACVYASLASGFMRCKVPLLWGIHHSNLTRSQNSRSTLAAAAACRWLSFQRRIHVAYCAEAARRTHERRGYCAERSVFVPNGYDPHEFVKDPGLRGRLRGQIGVSDDAMAFGMVARFDPIKDHATFLEAAGQATRRSSGKLAFVLIGDGMDESNGALMKLIEKNGLRKSVILAGRRDDIAATYSALDFLVLSSRGEAFPNVVCEGMLCELPCISTDVGDCSTIIGDTGFIAPVGSAEALARAFGRAAELSQGERLALGASARERIVARYSLYAYVAKHISIYEQMAGAVSSKRSDSGF